MVRKRDKWTFLDEYTVEERTGQAQRMRRHHPGCVPVVIARASRSRVGNMKELRVNVPGNMTLGQLHITLKDRLCLRPTDALIFLVGSSNTIVPPSSSLAYLYLQHSHIDLFLYLTYCEENALG
ncbi:hypothetical protein Pmani_028203 [Petrolisthes manimaculis]|uniref:Autophagy-related protein n=1 Tax=Petrolisthes manimaculis TaxID=1843537 RepID=A0AAE1P1I9_9EUCA|nr:hypothetical protein Pmani_028203 [Petrolisthes manimaculis]